MLKWTPKAEDDLDKIRNHIAKNFNADLAIDIVNQLIDYVEKTLNHNPLTGSILESNPLFSKLIFEGNSVYYCENPNSRDIFVVYVRPRGTFVKESRINDKKVA